MIRIDRKKYLKHTVTNLETPNEPSSTDFPMLGNYSCDSHFKNFAPLLSDAPLTQKTEMIFQEKSSILTKDTLFYPNPTLEITEQKIGEKKNNKEKEKSDCRPQI
jgi:hypothetical protein